MVFLKFTSVSRVFSVLFCILFFSSLGSAFFQTKITPTHSSRTENQLDIMDHTLIKLNSQYFEKQVELNGIVSNWNGVAFEFRYSGPEIVRSWRLDAYGDVLCSSDNSTVKQGRFGDCFVELREEYGDKIFVVSISNLNVNSDFAGTLKFSGSFPKDGVFDSSYQDSVFQQHVVFEGDGSFSGKLFHRIYLLDEYEVSGYNSDSSTNYGNKTTEEPRMYVDRVSETVSYSVYPPSKQVFLTHTSEVRFQERGADFRLAFLAFMLSILTAFGAIFYEGMPNIFPEFSHLPLKNRVLVVWFFLVSAFLSLSFFGKLLQSRVLDLIFLSDNPVTLAFLVLLMTIAAFLFYQYGKKISKHTVDSDEEVQLKKVNTNLKNVVEKLDEISNKLSKNASIIHKDLDEELEELKKLSK